MNQYTTRYFSAKPLCILSRCRRFMLQWLKNPPIFLRSTLLYYIRERERERERVECVSLVIFVYNKPSAGPSYKGASNTTWLASKMAAFMQIALAEDWQIKNREKGRALKWSVHSIRHLSKDVYSSESCTTLTLILLTIPSKAVHVWIIYTLKLSFPNSRQKSMKTILYPLFIFAASLSPN